MRRCVVAWVACVACKAEEPTTMGDSPTPTEVADSVDDTAEDTATTTSTVSPPGPPCEPLPMAWATPAWVDKGELTQPSDGAVGVDDQGRGYLLALERVGPRRTLWMTRFDGSWTPPEPLVDRAQSNGGWAPRVVLDGAGDGIAAYRIDVPNGGTLHRQMLAADGTRAPGPTLGDDTFASSVEVGIDDAGRITGAFTADDAGVPGVAWFEDDAPPTVVYAPPGGARLLSWSVAADGTGMAFALDDDGALALPYAPDTGFGPPERLAPEPTNGQYGAWLGDGLAVFAYGERASPTDRVQIFAQIRRDDGVWDAPTRIDTGDDSAHASLQSVVAAGPEAAFVQWTEPGLQGLGRIDVNQGLVDALDLGLHPDATAWDRCGRGVLLYRPAGSNELRAVTYLPTVGWQPDMLVDDGVASVGWASVGLAASGHVLATYDKQSRYWFSTLTP